MRRTFPGASYPACGDVRMYDLHHGLLMIVCYAVEMGIIKVVESQITLIAR